MPGWHGETVVLPGAREIFLPGCPAAHAAGASRWIAAYNDFKTFGRTPVELGLLRIEQLDPKWFSAVRLIEHEITRHSRPEK